MIEKLEMFWGSWRRRDVGTNILIDSLENIFEEWQSKHHLRIPLGDREQKQCTFLHFKNWIYVMHESRIKRLFMTWLSWLSSKICIKQVEYWVLWRLRMLIQHYVICENEITRYQLAKAKPRSTRVKYYSSSLKLVFFAVVSHMHTLILDMNEEGVAVLPIVPFIFFWLFSLFFGHPKFESGKKIVCVFGS